MKKNIKNILIIGLGNMGNNYMNAIMSLNCKVNLYLYDKNFEKLDKKLKNTKKIKFYKIYSLEKLITKLDLVIVSSDAKNRLNLIKELAKKNPKNWIIEKLIEQSVSSTNKIYRILNNKNCWVNIPRRSMEGFKFIKKDFIKNKNQKFYMKANTKGDSIVTNSIHAIDLMCWIFDSKISKIDTSSLNSWTESKRVGFYDIGGVLKMYLANNSKIIFSSKKKINKNHIFIGNKHFNWKIYEKNLEALRSDGLKIKIKIPLTSVIMKKIINNIFTKGICGLPKLEEVIDNHNTLIKSLKQHWLKANQKKISNLPVT
tara:strand:+ start:791 stop:1732 length:942 start_codon:yes stop_codon:yes gene_type:complete